MAPTRFANAFEEEFGLEILKSDKLRVTALMIVIASAMLLLMLMFTFASVDFQRSFHGGFKGFLLTVFTFVGGVLICLSLELMAINRMIKQKGKPRRFVRYVTAFIETSIPTIGIIVGSRFLGPIYTLFTPAAFIYPLFIVLSALRLDFRLCLFTGAVAGIEYSLLATYFVTSVSNTAAEPILVGIPHHLFKGFLLFAMGVVTGLVTLQIRKRILRSFEVVEERNRISRTFGEYVSPAVMNKLMELKPDLRSEKRNVCVMFLDIRDFTSFAEGRAPEEVVEYLDSLFEFMIEIVNKHHGIINKFLGDGFMAVFGAPLSDGGDCLNGVAAAREILSRVDDEVTKGRV
jgi:adenylate cyclase